MKLRSAWLTVSAICLALSSVRAEDPVETKKPDPREQIRQFQSDIEKLRGLTFKRPVEVGVLTKSALRERMIDEMNKEISDQKADVMRKVLAKFGLVPADIKVKELMIDLLSEQVAGFYDPHSKELYVIQPDAPAKPGPMDEMLAAQLGVTQDDIVAVHELTHALQDQLWNLETMPMEGVPNDDIVTAQKCLVEGEATYVMFDWMFGKMGLSLEALPAGLMEQQMGSMGGGMPGMETLEKAPKILRESLTFPYRGGLKYIMAMKKAGGWKEIDGCFADLPASTEQILHPEKQRGKSRDHPQAVTLPELDALLGPGWTLLDRNVMGEFSIDVFFQELMKLKPGKTKKASGGWDGDQYVCAENPAGTVALVWFTTWDGDEDAREFATALRKTMQAKYGVETPDVNEETCKLWKATSAGPVRIERRGSDVLLVESVPTEVLDSCVDTAWKGTTKTEVTKVDRIPEK